MKTVIEEYGSAILGVITIGFILGVATTVLVTGHTPGTLFHFVNVLVGRAL